MKRAILSTALFVVASAAFAQATPVGVWRNIDDKTGEVKAEIRVSESAGGLNARIEKRLGKDSKPDAVCTECADDRKGQPLDGLEIVRGVRKVEGKDVWEGGKILDPESGKVYTLRLTPIEGGARLEVRGSIGPFWRTQTWLRQP